MALSKDFSTMQRPIHFAWSSSDALETAGKI
jgi:hypothetical protein